MIIFRQILYILTLGLVGYTGATGGLDTDTAAEVVAQLLTLLTAGTALANTPVKLPGTTPAEVRPTLTGQTPAGAAVDMFGRLLSPDEHGGR